MSDRNTDGFEAQIVAAFARGSAHVSDGGFTRRVIDRIHRRRLTRGLVLGAAWIGGGLLAGMAAAAVTADFVVGVRAITHEWADIGWLAGYRTAIAGVLGGAAVVAVARLIED